MSWLTAHDIKVIRYSHLSYEEMGERLAMNPRTVKAHTDAIRKKLGVSNKRHLQDKCRELGITY